MNREPVDHRRVGPPIAHPVHLLPTMEIQLSLVYVDGLGDVNTALVLEGPDCWAHVLIIREILLLLDFPMLPGHVIVGFL